MRDEMSASRAVIRARIGRAIRKCVVKHGHRAANALAAHEIAIVTRAPLRSTGAPRGRMRQPGADAVQHGGRQVGTFVEPTGAVTLKVAGPFDGAAIPDFDRALERAQHLDVSLFLDLTGVTQIDRGAVTYLVTLLQRNFRLIMCPAFVERRMEAERSGRARD
jgi:hypothetical protein